MSGLNDLAPAIVGAGVPIYVWAVIFRIKREQAGSRETKAAQ